MAVVALAATATVKRVKPIWQRHLLYPMQDATKRGAGSSPRKQFQVIAKETLH